MSAAFDFVYPFKDSVKVVTDDTTVYVGDFVLYTPKGSVTAIVGQLKLNAYAEDIVQLGDDVVGIRKVREDNSWSGVVVFDQTKVEFVAILKGKPTILPGSEFKVPAIRMWSFHQDNLVFSGVDITGRSYSGDFNSFSRSRMDGFVQIGFVNDPTDAIFVEDDLITVSFPA
jgi:hypothetical protein